MLLLLFKVSIVVYTCASLSLWLTSLTFDKSEMKTRFLIIVCSYLVIEVFLNQRVYCSVWGLPPIHYIVSEEICWVLVQYLVTIHFSVQWNLNYLASKLACHLVVLKFASLLEWVFSFSNVKFMVTWLQQSWANKYHVTASGIWYNHLVIHCYCMGNVILCIGCDTCTNTLCANCY